MKAGVMFAVFAYLAVTAVAQDAAKGYERFKFTLTRNAFDPDRKAIVKSETPRPAAPAAARPAGVLLTGTMVTEGRTLAFFGSSRAEYNKVVGPNQTIAEFKVTKVSPGLVELERAGKQVMVTVGQSLPIEGAEPVNTANLSPAASAPSAAAPVSDAAPAVPADKSEVLRRMMERRQKENPQ